MFFSFVFCIDYDRLHDVRTSTGRKDIWHWRLRGCNISPQIAASIEYRPAEQKGSTAWLIKREGLTWWIARQPQITRYSVYLRNVVSTRSIPNQCQIPSIVDLFTHDLFFATNVVGSVLWVNMWRQKETKMQGVETAMKNPFQDSPTTLDCQIIHERKAPVPKNPAYCVCAYDFSWAWVRRKFHRTNEITIINSKGNHETKENSKEYPITRQFQLHNVGPLLVILGGQENMCQFIDCPNASCSLLPLLLSKAVAPPLVL